jgi:hypothetical protein
MQPAASIIIMCSQKKTRKALGFRSKKKWGWFRRNKVIAKISKLQRIPFQSFLWVPSVRRSRMSGRCRLSGNDVVVGGFWSSGREKHSHMGTDLRCMRAAESLQCSWMSGTPLTENTSWQGTMSQWRSLEPEDHPFLAVPYFLFSISQLASISAVSSSKSGTTFYRTSERNKEEHVYIMGTFK